jgi:tellurite resistance protein TehA-like permease
MRRFSVVWWAYSFPLTVVALASRDYAEEVKGRIANAIMLLLSGLAILASLSLSVLTVLNSKLLLHDNDPISSTLLNQLPTTSAGPARPLRFSAY